MRRLSFRWNLLWLGGPNDRSVAVFGISMLYLGIDSGTQSTKSIVLDLESGKILATAQKTYDLVPGLPPGPMEQEPHQWINAPQPTILEDLQKVESRKAEVPALAVRGEH